jgi:protein-S-isoprenylcysteine O-methyltransferase Ste14
MDAFLSFKFLHVATVIFAVALAVSGEIVLRRVAATRDATAIRTTIERTKPLGGIAGGLFVLAAVFGLLAAITGQIDLLRPWLIASYALFAGAFAISLGVIDPWVGRLEKAVGATAGQDGASLALADVVNDSRARAAAWGLQVIIVAIVFLMVVKPLG